MYQELLELFERFGPLSQAEKSLIKDLFVYREVPKKFQLVKLGEIAREVYFVKKGLIRLYYTKEGQEYTGFLFTEGLIASAFPSFLSRQVNRQQLESLEASELLVISYENFQRLYEEMPKMNLISRKIIESRFINAQNVVASFVLDTPEERYLALKKQHPEWFQRVPQHYIASFLGITPVSLSRIRKRLADHA